MLWPFVKIRCVQTSLFMTDGNRGRWLGKKKQKNHPWRNEMAEKAPCHPCLQSHSSAVEKKDLFCLHIFTFI